jgi:hypothetical protein
LASAGVSVSKPSWKLATLAWPTALGGIVPGQIALKNRIPVRIFDALRLHGRVRFGAHYTWHRSGGDCWFSCQRARYDGQRRRSYRGPYSIGGGIL